MRIVVTSATAVILALFGITIIFGSWYTIDQGERGVLLRNGAIVGVAEPGLGFKMPWFDSVVDISVQSRVRKYEQVPSYSRDQQPADLAVSVNYRMPSDKVSEIYANYGGESGLVDRLVDRRVYQQVKNVFGKFNAVTAIQERARLNSEAEAIRARGAALGENPNLVHLVQAEKWNGQLPSTMVPSGSVPFLNVGK